MSIDSPTAAVPRPPARTPRPRGDGCTGGRPLARPARRHRCVRPAGRSDHARLRPAHGRRARPPHPRPSRAGRRSRGRGLRRGLGQGRRRDRGRRAPARPTSSPRSPTPTWTRCRSCASPAGVLHPHGYGCLPGGRHRGHHDADHEALVPGEDRRGDPRRDRGGLRDRLDRSSRSVLVDITKDAQQAEAPFVWPPKIDLPGYRPVTKAHGKQIQPRPTARHRAQARAVRGRRCDPRQRGGGS